MKKLIAVLLLAWASMAAMVPGSVTCGTSPCTIYNQATAFGYTGDPFNITWSCTACATSAYEHVVEARRFPPVDTDVPVVKGVFPYNVFKWTLSLPRAGWYYVRIMDCPIGKRTVADGCSVWGNSYDLQTTNPVSFPRGFTLGVLVKPPTL